MVFGLPKNDRERRVPLPGSVADVLRAHLKEFPPVAVTLPWEDPRRGDPVTVPLVFTTTYRQAMRQNVFAPTAWRPALKRAGVELSRVNGVHALRHFYASALLDAGESVKAVAEWLGHCRGVAGSFKPGLHLARLRPPDAGEPGPGADSTGQAVRRPGRR